MQAYGIFLKNEQGDLDYEQYVIPDIPSGNKLVEIRASALNHRDIWIRKGRYPGIRYPIILGSDGAGLLDDARVLINPGWSWGEKDAYQSDEFMILGLPVNGTFSTHCIVPDRYIHKIPDHLNYLEAAALPLAGVTAYRALFTKARVRAGEKVFISGLGGGVSSFACQFAIALGCSVFGSSSSEEKRDFVKNQGVIATVDYREENWDIQFKKEYGEMDIVIDGAGGSGFPALVNVLGKGGRMAIYGGTRGSIRNLSPQVVFWKQLEILGTTMGSPEDFSAMLTFVNEYKITPWVDSSFSLQNAAQAMDRMDTGNQLGKIVLDHKDALEQLSGSNG